MIVIIRMRGDAGTRHDVVDTFRMLGMKKNYSFALLENTPSNVGMVTKLDSFSAWGNASDETVSLLKGKNGLKPPRGGFKSKRLKYPKGNLGNNGDGINDLVKRMV